MSVSAAPLDAGAAAWTCPFCPLLCDHAAVQHDAGGRLALAGSDCPRAAAALSGYPAGPCDARPLVDGTETDLATAVAAAARALHASRQPLMAGLGTDVAGARALARLAQHTGAIADATSGTALMNGLRALQDRGGFTTTFAEVRTRADLIVCIGGSPTPRLPEFWRRCGLGEDLVAARHVVFLGGTPADAAPLHGLPGITTEVLPLHGDLHATATLLAAAVARPSAPTPLQPLAERLRAAHYAVLVWENARLPAHGALVVETLSRVVNTLNRTTRAAALPLGGGDGAATANQVWAWLTGLPMRTRAGPQGLEHEPVLYDTEALLRSGGTDLLIWVNAFSSQGLPAVPGLPRVVLGPPSLAGPAGSPGSVYIPVATPGVGSAGHLFRADGVVLMPLQPVVDQGLPTVAQAVQQIEAALLALRLGGAR